MSCLNHTIGAAELVWCTLPTDKKISVPGDIYCETICGVRFSAERNTGKVIESEIRYYSVESLNENFTDSKSRIFNDEKEVRIENEQRIGFILMDIF